MWFGFPLIPVMLVASRFRIFDPLLGIIPPLVLKLPKPRHFSIVEPSSFLLENGVQSAENIATGQAILSGVPSIPSGPWSLEPSVTLCLLPWLRLGYNLVWDRMFSKIEQRWEAQSGGPAETYTVVEGFMDMNIIQHVADDDNDNDDDNNNENEDDINNREGPVNDDVEVGRRITMPFFLRLVRLCIGALFLPKAASISGSILGLIPFMRKRLPDTFSRSIIGGCLFIVAKDFMGLYYKYARMQAKRNMRIVNYTESQAMRQ